MRGILKPKFGIRVNSSENLDSLLFLQLVGVGVVTPKLLYAAGISKPAFQLRYFGANQRSAMLNPEN